MALGKKRIQHRSRKLHKAAHIMTEALGRQCLQSTTMRCRLKKKVTDTTLKFPANPAKARLKSNLYPLRRFLSGNSLPERRTAFLFLSFCLSSTQPSHCEIISQLVSITIPAEIYISPFNSPPKR